MATTCASSSVAHRCCYRNTLASTCLTWIRRPRRCADASGLLRSRLAPSPLASRRVRLRASSPTTTVMTGSASSASSRMARSVRACQARAARQGRGPSLRRRRWRGHRQRAVRAHAPVSQPPSRANPTNRNGRDTRYAVVLVDPFPNRAPWPAEDRSDLWRRLHRTLSQCSSIRRASSHRNCRSRSTRASSRASRFCPSPRCRRLPRSRCPSPVGRSAGSAVSFTAHFATMITASGAGTRRHSCVFTSACPRRTLCSRPGNPRAETPRRGT